MKVTMGGDRIGSGAGMNVDLKTYNRSNHNLSTTIKTTMAPGTLVPFLNMVGLPGDTFDIETDAMIFTKPTVGPLYDTYKFQIDLYSTAMRLYLPLLHNNPTMVGLNMASVKLPQIKITAGKPDFSGDVDNSQINPSCSLAYLGYRGIGNFSEDNSSRLFNALPYLTQWDIYKNYYANKQEEIGAVIHNVAAEPVDPGITLVTVAPDGTSDATLGKYGEPAETVEVGGNTATTVMKVYYTALEAPNPDYILIRTDLGDFTMSEMFTTINDDGNKLTASPPAFSGGVWLSWEYTAPTPDDNDEPQVVLFPLENIDIMRNQLLANIMSPTAYVIDEDEIAPYGYPLQWTTSGGERKYSKLTALEGLPLKTYQSDQFQNWMATDWITDINLRSKINTSDGLTMDALAMAKRVWTLLNRIAMADGSYKSWIDTVYTTSGKWRAETPVYEGGLSKEIIFDEVISNSASGTDLNGQPLGTLAGRGRLSSKHKGGSTIIKCEEMVQITGIASITPRIGYSQGNTWDVNLKTMDDFHKPEMDGIGFQDLLTDWMTWWNTEITGGVVIYKSAGKQPAWMNYRTNIDRNYGNFAMPSEMFMTLNRRYEANTDGEIVDLTTYIDPKKYNYVFAETARDAQNFWVQIKTDIKCRRVMSNDVIPNL